MTPIMTILPVLLPILGGALIPGFNFQKAKDRERYVLGVVLLNSVIIFLLFFSGIHSRINIVDLSPTITIAFRIDGLSMVFGGLLAGLWPLATLYAFEYMKHEGRENSFFTYYTITYGIAVGIAFSANLITMYLFYELLTLITVPMIMHSMNLDAVHGGRKYLIYSIAGATAALMGVIILYGVTGTTEFMYGGIVTSAEYVGDHTKVLLAYFAVFMGFGVKAAVFPFHGWLPTAGVAPTPVTALLHAVAVVKAGVFAIIRVTFYNFGTGLLRGTWVQYLVMAMAAFTIVFGSAMALREQHLKRRLAYSTVSNLSYILFGITLMTPEGLEASLSHMIFHGIMKICLFCCVGAIMYKTHRSYTYEIKGFGKKMPVTMFCFTIGSLALIGVPGFCGFISKWNLATAAVASRNDFAFVGICALMISAVFTAMYLFNIVMYAYFPGKDFDYSTIADVEDPNNYMKIPLILLCVAMLIFGLFSDSLMGLFQRVSQGLI